MWLEQLKDEPLSGRPEDTKNILIGNTSAIPQWENLTDDQKKHAKETLSIHEQTSTVKQVLGSGVLPTNIWPLLVREALWVSRLYNIKQYGGKERLPLLENIYSLWYAARAYADYERLCSFLNIDLDTSKLDKGLRNGNLNEEKMNLFESF